MALVAGFNKSQRLCKKEDFDHVFTQANKTITEEFIFLHKLNSVGYARIGFAISKRVVAKASQRNRLKRLLRESFRTHRLPAIDVIILARQGVAKVTNSMIIIQLGKTWQILHDFYVN